MYDVLTVHHDYELWTRMIEALARRHGLPARGRLLDVGCGTGKSFLPWLARGWRVVGCDQSPAMLSLAREKAPEVELLVADARQLEALGSFDLVLVLDDVVNYTADADHAALFRSCARNLAQDGLLVFDLNTLRGLRSFFSSADVREVDGCVAVWRGEASPELGPGEAADATVDGFVRDEDGGWRRIHARHREYHHPLDAIEQSLRDAGLEPVGVYGQDYECNVAEGIDELTHTKGLVIARRSTAEQFALHETVEAFPSTDGSIYFLRGGPQAEQVLAEPSADERRLLELLHTPRTLDELRAVAPPETVETLLDDLRSVGLADEVTYGRSVLPDTAACRYDRQLPYFAAALGGRAAAAEAQRRLLESSVCIVGCGGLGSWTAAALACCGVGRLVLVDDDTVELSNLNRQLLFRYADIGHLKVDAAADALRAFDPALEVQTRAERVASADDVRRLATGSDLIVATADAPRYSITSWINEGAYRAGIAHIGAAQFPPFVKVGPLFVPGLTGCSECENVAGRRTFPDHAALMDYRAGDTRRAPTVGPLSGLVGSILATEAMHLLSGVAPPATHGRAVIIDARDLSVTHEVVPRERECTVCGGATADRETPSSDD